MAIVITVLAYFCVLLLFSHLTARKMASNETFYRANRRSPWYMVAFGMVGASISGITFVSVPGMVMRTDMTYLQMCIGFILGYFLVAFLLLPIYYRYNLTTIYGYLQQRLGERSYKTGASFFLLSKMTGAAVRFFVVCILLQRFVLDGIGVPFWLTVPVMVLLIWLYTRKGGIKTLVWTDTFQTLCMFAALILIICQVMSALGMTPSDAITAIAHDSHSRIFVFDDWMSKQNFWKQFLSGVFVVIVMTGLDQDMMQKNMTEKTVQYFLTSGKAPEQGYKACSSLRKLEERYGKVRLENACGRIFAYKATPSVRNVSSILKNDQDKPVKNAPQKKPAAANNYGITRGASYFSKDRGGRQ